MKTDINESLIVRIFQSQKKKSYQVKTSTYRERTEKLNRLRDTVVKKQRDIEQAIYNDFGKPPQEVQLTEILPTLTEINYATKNLKRWIKPKRVGNTFPLILGKSYVVYEPRGVVLIISPWNYPFNLSIVPLVSAIAAGNCAVLKPSEFTPNTSLILKEIVSGVFAEDEIAVIEGDAETAKQLLTNPFDHVFFTGSTQKGKAVMAAAAEHLSSVTLELGGKTPAIVDESANVRDAAEKIIWGKFINAGQTCIAPDYVFVHRSREQEFLQYTREVLVRYFGNEANKYPRIIDRNHFDRLQYLLNDSIEKGAKVEAGGNHDEHKRHISPTILIDVPDDASILHEEVFGPVLSVVRYEKFEDVFKKISKNPYPLALYVFSNEKKAIKEILNAVQSGSVCVNDVVVQFPNVRLPFGGIRDSGFGAYHGYFGFVEFSYPRAVFYQSRLFSIPKIVYPPYNRLKDRILKWLIWWYS